MSEPPAGDERPEPKAPFGSSLAWRRALLAAILVLAAALRFVGLSWGLRHTPHWDERVFVGNAVSMVAAGDLDHRYYEYPGLFFYILYPVLALLHLEPPAGAGAYLAARSVVAAFGVGSVALAYALASRVMGPGAGLAAALLLAVSPIEIDTAHMVRPDVVLETFVLLALLAFRRVGPGLRGDLVSGLALGAATAVKFTGVFLVPSYLAYRCLAPGLRFRRFLAAGLVAATVAVALTPYALIHHRQFLGGVGVQWGAHYSSGAVAPRFVEILGYYLHAIVVSLGPVGAAMAVAGLWLARREWRMWVPLMAYPVTTLLVLSTAELRYSRHIVPTAGVLCVLAAKAVDALGRRYPRAAVVLAVAAALVPLADSAIYVRNLSRPSTLDRTLDWIEAQLPSGSRVLTTEAELGVDRTRIEVLYPVGSPELSRLLGQHVDLVAARSSEEAPFRGFRPVLRVEPDSPQGGVPMALYAVPEALRPSYRPVPLETARLTASENQGQLPVLADGRGATAWTTQGPQRPGAWVQVELRNSVRLGRAVLRMGPRPLRYGRDLRLLVTEDGVSWRRVPVVHGRPPVEEQGRDPRKVSQVLLLAPTVVRGIRLVQMGRGPASWGIAELELDERTDPP